MAAAAEKKELVYPKTSICGWMLVFKVKGILRNILASDLFQSQFVGTSGSEGKLKSDIAWLEAAKQPTYCAIQSQSLLVEMVVVV